MMPFPLWLMFPTDNKCLGNSFKAGSCASVVKNIKIVYIPNVLMVVMLQDVC